ncbi:SMI1/KNR4 family protein [Streptomyces sp. NPDC002734]|uniref:SMI1/KNR4 family protein n=1 Tax=Streptomyces sp. NPDC002734 TaxID=3154426 RepID=UPI00332D7E7C
MAPRIAPVPVSWDRIDRWLAVHSPDGLAVLAPPVKEEELREAARVLGRELPAELAESLRCHDGATRWTTVLPEQSPLSAAEVARHWHMYGGIAAENDGLRPLHGDDEPWWHPRWIPWAEGAGGDAQVIDTRPGPDAGRLGWAGHGGGGDFVDSWPGLGALLHAVAEALHHGGGVRDLHPFLGADGVLLWEEAGSRDVHGSPLVPAPVGLP